MKLHKSDIDEEIYYYFLKNGVKLFMYRHKYYDSLGRRREKKKSSFATGKAALNALLKVKAAILNGQLKHIEHSQMTVGQWFDIWYETKNRYWERATTRPKRKALIKNHIKPLLGRYKLSTLTASTYEREFINKLLDKGFEPSTMFNYHTIFKTAINAAVNEEIILRNRFTKIKIDRDDILDNFLDPSELNLFLTRAKKYSSITSHSMILLLAYSGLRRGEALGLKWKNIDFKKNTIAVERTRDNKGERKPKTKKSIRTIDVDPIVINNLEHYKKWCIETMLRYGKHLNSDDYVFISHLSQNVNQSFLNHCFAGIYQRMENEGIKLKRITPHGLRHTHATILIDELIPPTDVADRLGNSLEMIYRVYAHSIEKVNDKTVTAFSNRLKQLAE
ncbi:tyrosine-type recombinase/integrase [Pseudogracilibacillus auburnensis]|uniref:Integrase-like protein n=1 Tax=Pseudogracilibacillus auburnensis TaxID=1494959 RepID=A0A2V3W4Z8_9BACI|nr:site-specific integrase [Pseudogracilibacillus auburnensis]PXW88776.1 integrase-like protein [Pseudogracilibacillus auburnensis]